MILYVLRNDKYIKKLSLEEVENYEKFNFFGNLEHLKSNYYMYHIINDEIKLNSNYEKERDLLTAKFNLEIIRQKRKALFRAFDTLENKYINMQQGFIRDDEFPFIAEITDERWEEIKAWRNQLRDLTGQDLLNVKFPPTPQEVEYFLK